MCTTLRSLHSHVRSSYLYAENVSRYIALKSQTSNWIGVGAYEEKHVGVNEELFETHDDPLVGNEPEC